MRGTAPLLRLRGVSRRFPAGAEETTVLSDIDLDVRAGEMLAIVGQSGSGKSTLMNLLGCLDRPSTGRYEVAGRDVCGLAPDALAALRRDRFGFIFQRYHLLAHLSAEENVCVPGIYAGTDASLCRARAAQLLGRLGLADHAGHRPAMLSGGQQQRVGIARALMNCGAVILADEPTGALDSRSGGEVVAILRELHRLGHTVIVVTHDMAVAGIAPRVVEIRDGRIVADRGNGSIQAGGAAPPDKVSATDSADVAATGFASTTSASAPAPAPVPASPRRVPPGARIGDSGAIAWAALTRHRLRSALTMLGIAIGIAAVVSMVALGKGARAKLLEEIQSFGADAIFVLPGEGFNDRRAKAVRTLRDADVDLLRAQSYIADVTPVLRTLRSVRGGSVQADVSIVGVDTAYFSIRNSVFQAGAAFRADAARRMRAVVVIDEPTRRAFFPPGTDPIGATLLVGSVPSTVVGVLAADDANGGGPEQMTVYMPVTTVGARLSGRHDIDYLMVKTVDGVTPASAEPRIENLLLLRHRVKDFFVFSYDKQLKAAQRSSAALNWMILAIACVSLLVAGIGVMNIMLVSVVERTAEVGLRMAVGARQVDIRRQFLYEGIIVASLGGAAGVAISLAVQQFVPLWVPTLPMIFSWSSIAGACLMSMAVGVAFGYLPARNAARLDPIRALTHG
ncbi:ABC transporter permease [Robbsia sp. Bb-Pol-6]|uniref:Pyoverdine export ATP-binding/permease protein PvdT n=1 Tax=Robbsia betulipollinis TaxID=2981849 RepID=A0ABT3ZGN3_9BURK|nr:ABC transporter permease [Robbsia betulipollinis]MCY0385691.1 ABC transporter permease [Robbsia betulipollinis]